MLKSATRKEVVKPMDKKRDCVQVNVAIFLIKSNPVAANIVGTASKNENSMMVFRLSPNSNPPKIVAADLETPGIIAIA